MQFSLSRLRPAAVVLLAFAFAACSDDDGGTNPPATPPAPTGLAAERATDGLSIEVTWTAVNGATSYTNCESPYGNVLPTECTGSPTTDCEDLACLYN